MTGTIISLYPAIVATAAIVVGGAVVLRGNGVRLSKSNRGIEFSAGRNDVPTSADHRPRTNADRDELLDWLLTQVAGLRTDLTDALEERDTLRNRVVVLEQQAARVPELEAQLLVVTEKLAAAEARVVELLEQLAELGS